MNSPILFKVQEFQKCAAEELNNKKLAFEANRLSCCFESF